MAQGFFTWLLTAGSNGNADSSINFLEGQPPSSVNDSARALMSRLREFGNDISGSIVTTGSSTAYAVATGQGFDSLAHLNGQMVAFVPHTTNGATVTLNVDGLGAKPLRSGPSLELQSGSLIAGTPYVATYNSSDSAFYVHGNAGIAAANCVPLGAFLPYSGSTAPNTAFALPFGQAISRTTYATYFSLVSTTFGSGDGSTTFNIPDLRGRSVFGLDNMGGSAASRITVAGGNFDATVLGGTGGTQNHTLTTAEVPTGIITLNFSDPGHVHMERNANGGGASGNGPQNVASSGAIGDIGINTGSSTTGISASLTDHAGGGAHTNMPPAIALPYILRVI